MTDRELLELAAKAAEIRLYGFDDDEGRYFSNTDYGSWNPLTDDGDALRLAVKLELNVEYCRRWNAARVISNPDNGLAKSHAVNNHNLDPYAATRRAIVMAAAEIGKTL
jgi:hypothetical protein